MKILITSGGTSENIDSVRVITNKSSGRTGKEIAQLLINNGLEITFISAKRGNKPSGECTIREFYSFQELSDLLEEELKENHYDAIIHSAAVSDFSVIPFEGKISSDSPPELKFKKNPKIIDMIRSWSKNKNIKIVGFKLTANASEDEKTEAINKIMNRVNLDFLVHNDIVDINQKGHISKILNSNKEVLFVNDTTEELAINLYSILISK